MKKYEESSGDWTTHEQNINAIICCHGVMLVSQRKFRPKPKRTAALDKKDIIDLEKPHSFFLCQRMRRILFTVTGTVLGDMHKKIIIFRQLLTPKLTG